MKDTAQGYLAAGWRPIPVDGKLSLVTWEQFQSRAPTTSEVDTWWTAWPNAGVALVLGPGSGVVRVDVDGAEKALAEFGGMPETAEFTTPSGGRGYLLQYEPWMTTKKLWTGNGQHEELRVQSNGAYTVLPPSPGYAWVRTTPVARAPRWMLNWYAERALRETPSATLRCDLRPDELAEALAHIPSDDYDTWVQVGMALKSQGDDKLQVWETWSRGSTKFKAGECQRKWESFNGDGLTIATVVHLAKQAGWKPLWSPHEPLTEGGNAKVLARSASGRALYSPKLGWLAWDGRKWTTGEEAECLIGGMQREALDLRRRGAIASMLRVSDGSPEADVRRRTKVKTLGKIDQLDRASCYAGSRRIARDMMLCDWTTFNVKPRLLNFLNGTLDLETGQLRPHNQADRLTTVVPHEYDPCAPRSVFEAFLRRSLPDDATREYVHVKLGSTLLGETRKELLIFWGPNGDNGKTMLIELMQHALGVDYAVTCSNGLLLQRSIGDDDRNTVQLFGMRFAAASETNEGAKLNEALLKSLTGGDKINTRYLFKEKFSFEPTHDIVYVTNHKPVLRGTEDALWNRIKLVEFSQSFPVGHPERVEGLREALRAEVKGFLTWLAEGCARYVQAGKTLVEPEVVRRTTTEYRQEHNHVARFLEGWTKTDGTAHTIKGRVVEAFKLWCQRNADSGAPTTFNPRWFGGMLTKAGVESDANYYFLTEKPS